LTLPRVLGSGDQYGFVYLSGHASVILFAEFATIGVVLLGVAARRQRETLAVLVARNDELVRLRAVEAESVAIAERTRIARELHDVVAHHVSAIAIRAQAASRVAERDTSEAVAAVGWIAHAGQDALNAMRRTVRVLRGADQSGSAVQSPEPELDDLPEIVDRVRAAGLDVHLAIDVDAAPGPHVQLAAVRIVQESLTNVLVHSGASTAYVDVAQRTGELSVVVEDDGRQGPPSNGAAERHTNGHGLIGMRERALSCGGSLELGQSEFGGWKVQAQLPLDVP
jgi:signal transduction histidine kinase